MSSNKRQTDVDEDILGNTSLNSIFIVNAYIKILRKNINNYRIEYLFTVCNK